MSSSPTPAANAGNADDDAWLTPRRFAGLLALLTFASFPPILLGVRTFVVRDFGSFSYPLAYHLRESFWRGELPLWNPLNYCGLPFLAEWNPQALYPPALFYLLLPLSWSLGVFGLLHLFWGGLGMFFLARGWARNPFAAAFAGVVFAFNGLTLNSVIWPSIIAGLGWMPWVVWLTERAWREGGRTLVIAAIAGALQMLSGAVEVIALTWLMLGALGLMDLVRGEKPRGRIFFRAGLVVLLISGLAAAQLLPFFDLLNHSHRQGGYHGSQWPMPASGWLNFLVPMFHYQSSGNGYFVQTGQFWAVSYYVGVVVMALAVGATARMRRARVWLLAGLTLLCLVLALGEATPVYAWLCRHFKPLGVMRFPIKFVILPVFALPLLAACGLVEKKLAGRRSWFWIWILPLVLIAGIIGFAHRHPAPNDDWHATWLNALMRAGFLTAIVGGLFLRERIADPRLRNWLQLLVLSLVWLDLYSHLPQPPTVPRAAYQPNMEHDMLAPKLGTSRAAIPYDTFQTLLFVNLPDAAQDLIVHRALLFSDCNLLDDLPTCNGFFPLYPREWAELPAESGPLLDFMGVSQILLAETNTFRWTPRATSMPLLTGGQKPVFLDESATLKMLADTNFDPRAEVCLPLAAQKSVAATNPAAVKISAASFAAQKIEAEVEAAAPAMLVVAQTYYHPWRAYVDGTPTQLWRGNFAFQALEIPAGSHRVKLVYEDRRFQLGAALSLTTLAGCVIYFCVTRRTTNAARVAQALPD